MEWLENQATRSVSEATLSYERKGVFFSFSFSFFFLYIYLYTYVKTPFKNYNHYNHKNQYINDTKNLNNAATLLLLLLIMMIIIAITL